VPQVKKTPNRVAVSIRLKPEVKAAAEKLAKGQNRTLTNLIETLLAKACEEAKEL